MSKEILNKIMNGKELRDSKKITAQAKKQANSDYLLWTDVV